MEFFIKKNATLPLLKMKVVNDGRSDYQSFMKSLEVSSIYFSMIDVETGIHKIFSTPADIVSLILPNGSEPEYYIYYKFNPKNTNKVGRFQGEFLVKNDEGNLIIPIREELFINVEDSVLESNPVFPTPLPTRTQTPTVTSTMTPTQTMTPTNTETPTQTPTVTCTQTVSPTVTPSNTKTQTQTPTVTNTPTVTETPTTTPTPTNTPSNTQTQTPTVTNTPTTTNTPSNTETQTQTPTNTPTNTETPTQTPTNTETPTQTPTNSETPTPTTSETPTETPTPTTTETPTSTPTPSITESLTPSPTNTETPTQTPTNTETIAVTPTQTPTNSETPTETPTPTQTPTNTETPPETPTQTPTVSPSAPGCWLYTISTTSELEVPFYFYDCGGNFVEGGIYSGAGTINICAQYGTLTSGDAVITLIGPCPTYYTYNFAFSSVECPCNGISETLYYSFDNPLSTSSVLYTQISFGAPNTPAPNGNYAIEGSLDCYVVSGGAGVISAINSCG